MQRELRAAVRAASSAFLELTETTTSCHRADRALTLHLLERHAPRTFDELGLEGELARALAALSKVPRRFPKGLAWYELMARVDALYLLQLRAPHEAAQHAAFDERGLARALERLRDRGHLGIAWVLAALSVPLGVTVDVPAPPAGTDVEASLSELTHDVLIGSDYLSEPPQLGPGPAQALLSGATWAVQHQAWDILGELVFCLEASGRESDPSSIDALLGAQQADGHFEERRCRTRRERAHTTATCLVALAGHADRQRRG